ncbi:methionyl-tRNA formyltransferase [Archangium violaceum]|uniref:methionyl-tRNA formyltransferase n=1 Tax=Archangium violaceum TaxID=83451 RepID=UPI00193B7952|nr:formyltransferase family protein [Archangium violaceum]QRK13255.1 methionyl-tRNA formyltransferase [Archangium violaceum]
MSADPPTSATLRTSGWRIALLTVAPSVAFNFTHYLRARSHEVVALVTPPGPSGPRPRNAAEWTDMRRLFEAAPSSLDVVIASERSHLAPLLSALKPDFLLCFFFPWRIPPEALAVAPLGAVNGHPSLLPRYRGPNPMGWTLRNDDKVMGVSFHRMDAHFDTGPLLDQARAPIEDSDTEESLMEKMMSLSLMMMPQVLERVAWGDAGEPQPETGVSHAPFFEPAYREVDWRQTARAVHLQVRACRFGAWQDKETDARATLEGRRVRVQRTRLVEEGDVRAAPGTVLAREGDGLLVQCGDAPLWVLRHAPEEA